MVDSVLRALFNNFYYFHISKVTYTIICDTQFICANNNINITSVGNINE